MLCVVTLRWLRHHAFMRIISAALRYDPQSCDTNLLYSHVTHSVVMQGAPVAIAITPIHTIQADMPLTTALSMLLEAGISALPVVDGDGVLLDVYARGDITLLVRSNAYSRLQFEEMTVGQALSLVGGASQVAPQPGSSSGALLLIVDASMTRERPPRVHHVRGVLTVPRLVAARVAIMSESYCAAWRAWAEHLTCLPAK